MTDGERLMRGEVVRLRSVVKYLRGELWQISRTMRDGQASFVAGSIAETALERTKGEEVDHD